MKCVEAQRMMRTYIDRQLPDKDAEQFLAHVQNCRDCREELELFLTISDTLSDTGEAHPGEAMGVDKHIEHARNILHRRKLQRFAIYVLMAMAGVLLAGLVYMALYDTSGGNSGQAIEMMTGEAEALSERDTDGEDMTSAAAADLQTEEETGRPRA